MSSRSIQPRRQRKAVFTAHAAERRKRMTVPLSRELRTKYKRRNLPVRKGDTVRIISGSYVGQEQRVAKVQRRIYAVTLDNVTGKTAEAKLKPLPVRPSHLVLTKLNLSDPWRRRILRVPADEVPEEPETSPAPAETPEPETAPTAVVPDEEKDAEEAPMTTTAPAEPEATTSSDAAAEPAPEAPAKKPRRRKPTKKEEE